MKPYIVKYDYEAMFGIGTIIIFAEDPDDCVDRLRDYMSNRNDDKWMEYTFHRSNFRHVSTNVFGWNTYYNDTANVCIKVKEIDSKFGGTIPIYEHFEIDEKGAKY